MGVLLRLSLCTMSGEKYMRMHIHIEEEKLR